jgi:hypothetical protein
MSDSMLKNQLLAEVPAPTEHRGLGWRQDENGAWVALRITADGLRAIGVEMQEPADISAAMIVVPEPLKGSYSAWPGEELFLSADACTPPAFGCHGWWWRPGRGRGCSTALSVCGRRTNGL